MLMLDDETLSKARAAGARLADAERQVLLARGDYHAMIRRLHLGGGSLREIAQALELSHQRVQQIVDAGGGSWWQRVWRTRKPARDAVCTFCGGAPSEVAKLIAGPDVFVCDACVASAERATKKPVAGFEVAREGSRAKCSFCGKARTAERKVVVAKDASVCGECLVLCRQILDDRSGSATPA
jgi:hypothetical protein